MISLAPEESAELAGSVRAVCERMATIERVREIAYVGDGFDREMWNVLCEQIGVSAIAAPEAFGGAGYGAAALGVVAHELGRALAPVPLLASTVLATGLLLDPAVESPVDVVSSLAAGKRIAAPILTADGGWWQRDAVSITAKGSDAQWRLDGTAAMCCPGWPPTTSSWWRR